MQLLHILHDPTFDADYARFRAEPDRAPLAWMALLFVILSVSVTGVSEHDPLLQELGRRTSATENISILCRRYRTAAMECLEADHYLWRHNIYTLQTLIILIYGINQTHGQSWALLGTARNIALSLGCHVDPDAFNIGIVPAEERRRCWAGLNMLYTIQNSTLGHLDSSMPSSNVRLPLDVDDDQLSAGRPIPESFGNRPSQMSYLLLKFSLYDICSRICSNVLGQNGSATAEVITAFDSEIAAQQEGLNLKYLVDTVQSPLPDYHAVHLHILFGYSHQLKLLLHRPVLMEWVGSRQGLGQVPESVAVSRNKCMESSRALVGIYRVLYETDIYAPYQWYTRGLGSFHAFHAAICLVYILRASDDLDPAVSSLVRDDLENTLAVFEKIERGGLSSFCSRATPILRKLLYVPGSLLLGTMVC